MRDFSAGHLPVVALLALVAAVFVNALGVTFLLDDIGDIVGNVSAAAETVFERLPLTNRPVTKLTYALNDALHGAVPSGYAAVNLALHLVATVCAFILCRRALTAAGMSCATAVALSACALWAVHPALTESVTYLSGRSMVLGSVLMLGAMLAATSRQPRLVTAFLCAALAPLARETALVLPLVLLWWRFTIGGPVSQGPVWLGTLLAAAVIALMPHHRDLIAFSLEMRDPITALRGNIHAAVETLTFWVMPWRVTILPEAPLPYGWLEVPTLARLAGFLAAVALALVLRRRMPVIAFGIGLALLALAPSQTLIWRADPVALKPLYLAGLGLSLAAADCLRRIAGIRIAVCVSVLVALSLGAMTASRNVLFASATALYGDAVQKTPDNPDALVAYGGALVAEQRYDEAHDVLTRALDRAPHDERAMNLLELVATFRGVAPADMAP